MGNGVTTNRREVRDIYQFSETDVIGKGSSATVYKACLRERGRVSRDGVPIPDVVAIKIINKSALTPHGRIMLKDERKIMSKIHHPNCASLYEHFEDKTTLCLVMPYISGGELHSAISTNGAFSEEKAARIVKQLAEAIQYLGSKNIVHRDVKPENVMLCGRGDDVQVILGDFGLATSVSNYDDCRALTAMCGTPYYVAPELLRKRYGGQVDIWAVGVIMYVMLCGYLPFYAEGNTNQPLFRLIKAGAFEFHDKYWSDISTSAKHLIRRILNVDPTRRATPEEILNSEWIRRYCQPASEKKSLEELGPEESAESISQVSTQFVY